MRTLRLSLAGMIILALLGGLGGAVLAQTDDVEPTEFTAAWTFGVTSVPGDISIVDGVYERRGSTWRATATGVSDPRLDGTVTVSLNSDTYGLRGAGIARGVIRIENADGAWEDDDVTAFNFVDQTGPLETGVLVGEGAYEGLVAIVDGLFSDDDHLDPISWEVRGMIIDRELPAPGTLPTDD
jgi:hypothetical protein